VCGGQDVVKAGRLLSHCSLSISLAENYSQKSTYLVIERKVDKEFSRRQQAAIAGTASCRKFHF
jgi:hypothetical protein